MEPNWENLAHHVRTRRMSRGWSQATVTAQGGPSDTLQSRIENGEWAPKRGVDDTLSKLDSGLKWVEGSASRALAGDEPLPVEAVSPDERPELESLAASSATFSEFERNLVGAVVQSTLRHQYDANERKLQDISAYQSINVDTVHAIKALMDLQKYVNEADRLDRDELDRLIQAVRTPLHSIGERVVNYSAESNAETQRLVDINRSLIATSRHLRETFSGGDLGDFSNVVPLMGPTGADPLRTDVPPPDIGDLDVAASRREKQSDGECNDGDEK
ncbi:Bacteriophage protein [Mycobacteroides abscessus subsp. massiliense]|uniref:helix-turn-helix domain-containing protein n=1 Tax=Mycobacteroides abscessus TaxID=36809 RepID=UPI0009CE80E6|nr:helix-turn-helix domain-containing protein [Mycobacteroides abscessus]SKI79711.1 Bacteriophage protein [Mycobacteroides abscessus subsp. massiliense]